MLQVSNAIVSMYWVWQLYSGLIQQLAELLSWYMLDHMVTWFSSFVSSCHCNSVCFVVVVNSLLAQ
jgi:hypothetical protein